MKKIIFAVILSLVIISTIGISAYATSYRTADIKITSYQQQAPAGTLTMRVYYLQATYEAGKHKIIKVWSDKMGIPAPEDNADTNINVPYSVLEIDYKYNRDLCRQLASNTVFLPNGVTFDRFYVDDLGVLYTRDGNLVTINLNPNIEALKLSQLYNLTQAQLEAYIDDNVTSLATAKDYLKKLSAVVLYILKNSDMEK